MALSCYLKSSFFICTSFPVGSLRAGDKKEEVRVCPLRQKRTIPRVVKSAAGRERQESFGAGGRLAG